MNKKSKIVASAVLCLGIIVAVLLYNKSQMNARSKNDLQAAFAVTVSPVVRCETARVEPVIGTILANHDVAIVSETQGKVTAIYAEVGDTKHAGAPIIQVDDELKKAAFAAAEVSYEKARKDFERFESMSKENAVTDQQLESMRFAYKAAEAQYVTARRQYHDAQITTPISGVVTARVVDVGAMVQPGMVVANVVDLSLLKVKASVGENDAFKIHQGDSVNVTTDVYPGVMFSGVIHFIGAKADEAHTYPVEVRFPNSAVHQLRAGMFARVNFQNPVRSSALMIPRMALIGSVREPKVYVVENGTAKLRMVIVGSELGTNVEILTGLKEGENVVVNGQINLKDNAAVTIDE